MTEKKLKFLLFTIILVNAFMSCIVKAFTRYTYRLVQIFSLTSIEERFYCSVVK